MGNMITTANARTDTAAGLDINRQLEAAFKVFVKGISPLTPILLSNAGKKRGINTKYEWYEHTMSRVETGLTTGIAANYFDDSEAKNVIVTSNSNINVGDTLRFETSSGIAVSTLLVYVTEVLTSGVAVKAIKVGGDGSVAIASGSKVVFVSSALPEGSDVSPSRAIRYPSVKYNYFQIFDTVLENSRTVQGSSVIGDFGKIIDLRKNAFYDINRQLTEMVAHGIRAKKEIGGKEIRFCGGLSEFIENTQDGGGIKVEQKTLDTAVETIVKGGGIANTIRVNTRQAMQISGIDNSKIQMNLTDQIRGNVVTAIQSSIPVQGSKIERIIVDTTMPEDVIEIFDVNNMALVPFSNGGITERDATMPGADGNRMRIIGEYTLEAKNMKETSVRINNLSTTL